GVLCSVLLVLMPARQRYTPFPYTTLFRSRTTADDLEPKPMPMTERARETYESRRFGDDDVLRCMPAGLPRIFGSPYPMEILNAGDRKSTRLNSSHVKISYAVFCLKKKKNK